MEKDFNEYELNYIKFNYMDDSANVYFKGDGRGHYTVYAKPVKGSKSAYKIPTNNDHEAYFLLRALADLSVGYAFEKRSTKKGKNARVIATPKTNDATLKLELDDRVTAAAYVKFLRKQEVLITKKLEENKKRNEGTTLIRAKIGENLVPSTEETKADSLISAMLDRQFDLEDENAALKDRNNRLKANNEKVKELVQRATTQTYNANNNLNNALRNL